jgi:hypothetical protein
MELNKQLGLHANRPAYTNSKRQYEPCLLFRGQEKKVDAASRHRARNNVFAD